MGRGRRDRAHLNVFLLKVFQTHYIAKTLNPKWDKLYEAHNWQLGRTTKVG